MLGQSLQEHVKDGEGTGKGMPVTPPLTTVNC